MRCERTARKQAARQRAKDEARNPRNRNAQERNKPLSSVHVAWSLAESPTGSLAGSDSITFTRVASPSRGLGTGCTCEPQHGLSLTATLLSVTGRDTVN